MSSRPLPAALRGRVFRGTTAVASGLLTPGALRTPMVRRVFRDCYADAGLDLDHATRCRALALVLPDRVTFAGSSAAALHGVPWVDADAPVVVATPHPSVWGPMRGVRVVRRRSSVASTLVAGLRVDVRDEVLFQLTLEKVELAEAVVLVDAALARWPVLTRRLAGLTAAWAGRPGVRRVRRVLAAADHRAESPMESRVRVWLGQAGLPPPAVQHVIRDGGRFVARVDLAWPDQRVAVEYDGRGHNASDQQFRDDRRRLNDLTRGGWAVVHLTSEARGRPEEVVRQVAAVLATRAGAVAVSPTPVC